MVRHSQKSMYCHAECISAAGQNTVVPDRLCKGHALSYFRHKDALYMVLAPVAKTVYSPLLSTVCVAWCKTHDPHVRSEIQGVDVQHADMLTAMH